MPHPDTRTLAADDAGLAEAAGLLAAGRLVAFPTETVYGLGADARSDEATAAIFAAKNRPQTNPLIVHVESLDRARGLAEFPADALRLAEAFWPGPLTLVLPLKPGHGLAPRVTAGLGTVGLRVPGTDLARRLIAAAGTPVAAPSANPSGRVSPTSAAHVLQGLSGRIAAVLDGGPCAVGLESTIVGFDPEPTLLRPGGLPSEAIEACLGRALALRTEGAPLTAPGQMESHYAPAAHLRLNVIAPDPGETLIGFGPVAAPLNLSPSGDLHEAAATLFHTLRLLDERGATRAAVSPIPEVGLGRAINDRLRRAAAPRPQDPA
ncbi:L-threonylcarbamoyladenylate synthase [Oceaniglobus roseus]|uniref:L-threonylcarbamoyladenylate synthase n=1 Tax=Oceaniglobus roseus TaxID=1737570 RepID=UPI000C7E95A7|nr:L-threonylcarbamoyladenylate synthase [Kandeliimicrobium roseum]